MNQHKRSLHHEPKPTEPISHFYEAGNVEFAGPEPEEHADGLAMFGRVIGALAGLAAFVLAGVLILSKI